MASSKMQSLAYDAGRIAAEHPKVVLVSVLLLALLATGGTVGAEQIDTASHDTNTGP